LRPAGPAVLLDRLFRQPGAGQPDRRHVAGRALRPSQRRQRRRPHRSQLPLGAPVCRRRPQGPARHRLRALRLRRRPGGAARGDDDQLRRGARRVSASVTRRPPRWNREMRQLLVTLTDSLDARRPCVLCSVVETRGSTPQKAGAAMLVFADGTQVGTLGGGCVEAEVRRRALHALASAGRPELHTFTLDDDFGWDDGLICGGRMTILAEPLTPEANAHYP